VQNFYKFSIQIHNKFFEHRFSFSNFLNKNRENFISKIKFKILADFSMIKLFK
jgi:hypothetical protein